MDDRTLLRIAGFAAIAGGALRIADAFFAARLNAPTLEILYFLTDILLLGGILGIYFPQRLILGWAGVAATAFAFLGFLIIRSETVRFFGFGGYGLGAPIVLLGTTVLGCLLAVKRMQRVAATFWLSALAIGIAMPCCEPQTFTVFVAGILYGAGFVAAGLSLAFKDGKGGTQIRLGEARS